MGKECDEKLVQMKNVGKRLGSAKMKKTELNSAWRMLLPPELLKLDCQQEDSPFDFITIRFIIYMHIIYKVIS